MDKIDERIEGIENLMNLLDDMLFYVNLKPNDVPLDIFLYQSKLKNFLETRLYEIKAITEYKKDIPLNKTSKIVKSEGNYTHSISESTYNSHFNMRKKIKWNGSNQDIYFSEGL